MAKCGRSRRPCSLGARSRTPLLHRSQNDDSGADHSHAQHECSSEQVSVAQFFGQRARQAQGGVDRHHRTPVHAHRRRSRRDANTEELIRQSCLARSSRCIGTTPHRDVGKPRAAVGRTARVSSWFYADGSGRVCLESLEGLEPLAACDGRGGCLCLGGKVGHTCRRTGIATRRGRIHSGSGKSFGLGHPSLRSHPNQLSTDGLCGPTIRPCTLTWPNTRSTQALLARRDRRG